ncbi:MAG: proline racemase family protein [Pirellulaceae bacterium]
MQPVLDVIDSHTAGEPTRTVVSTIDALQGLTAIELRDRMRSDFDWIRTSLICEPRGSDVMVGALLAESTIRDCVASVVFFNNVGYLGMCGHGLIGVVTTLAYLKRIGHGPCRIETPVGVVEAEWLPNRAVRFQNVPAFRHRTQVRIDLPGEGFICGDVAWGGNWFFLSSQIPGPINWQSTGRLTEYAKRVRTAVETQGITGADGAVIDHFEFFLPSSHPDIDADNFVLCPGGAFDRSPCGTGTSAKLACLAADGKLAPGQAWRQRSVTGGVFEGSYQPIVDDVDDVARILPTISGTAYINGRTELLRDPADPLVHGLPSLP